MEKTLKELSEDPDYLTFSGNGEPTLHPEFGEIVEVVKKVRDRHSKANIALLSTSSKVNEAKNISPINKVDLPIMKLDVGSSEKFDQLNRPAEIQFSEVVEGLNKIENLHLQSIKFKGEFGNAESDVEDWVEIAGELQPQKIQIYSLDRPCRFNLEEFGKYRLRKIKKLLTEKDVTSEIF